MVAGSDLLACDAWKLRRSNRIEENIRYPAGKILNINLEYMLNRIIESLPIRNEHFLSNRNVDAALVPMQIALRKLDFKRAINNQ